MTLGTNLRRIPLFLKAGQAPTNSPATPACPPWPGRATAPATPPWPAWPPVKPSNWQVELAITSSSWVKPANCFLKIPEDSQNFLTDSVAS